MDEQITRTRKRKSILDRLHDVLLDDDEPVEPVITKGKLNKIRQKFDEPKRDILEKIDEWEVEKYDG
jgi:hypothetical protein